MAVIPGLTVDWTLSPRLINIPQAVREVSAQDLVDTLREEEFEYDGMDEVFPLIDSATSGKVPLDDEGTQVAITLVLLNAQIYFEPKTTPVSNGTATSNTTALPTSITLVDTGATFQTDGATRGWAVYNSTTGAWGTIIEVPSETSVVMLPLTGGSRADWQIGDAWVLYEQEQASLSGGNIVAIDDETLRNFISSVLESPFVQVVRTSSASATLQELEAVQYSSYGGGVTIDTTSSTSGTSYPAGTQEYPVNNLADAHDIAEERGFRVFYIRGDLTIDTEVLADGYIFIGQSTNLTTLTLNASANVSNCEFKQCTITGDLDGNNTLQDCTIQNLNYVNGMVTRCGITGTITLGTGAQANFVDCYSGVAGGSTPTLDFGSSGQALLIRNYHGGIKLQNKTGTDPVSIDMSSGQVIVDSTITNGTVFIRGIAKLTNNATGTAVIDVSGLIFADQLQLTSFGGFVHIDTGSSFTGTTFPVGTSQYPVNNLDDALAIATNRNLQGFHLDSDITIGALGVVDQYHFRGSSPNSVTVTLTSGCSTQGTEFRDLSLTGVAGGAIIVRDSWVQNLSNVGSSTGTGSVFFNTQILGTVTFQSGIGTPTPVFFLDCYDGAPGAAYSALDINDSTNPFSILGWKGSLQFQNWTAGQSAVVSYESGRLLVDATCTTGTLDLSGIAAVEDNSTGTFALSRRGHVGLSEDITPSQFENLEKVVFNALVAALNAGA